MAYYIKCLLVLVIFLILLKPTYAQEKYKFVINQDTFKIELSQYEKDISLEKRRLVLNKVGSKKRKILKEGTTGSIRLLLNDSVYWTNFIDFYDNHFIGFLSIKKIDSNNKISLDHVGFRRISYDSLILIETDGHKNILPKFSMAIVGIPSGFGLIFSSIKSNISLAFLPIGIGIEIASLMLFNEIATKEYFINTKFTEEFHRNLNSNNKIRSWSISVLNKNKPKVF